MKNNFIQFHFPGFLQICRDSIATTNISLNWGKKFQIQTSVLYRIVPIGRYNPFRTGKEIVFGQMFTGLTLRNACVDQCRLQKSLDSLLLKTFCLRQLNIASLFTNCKVIHCQVSYNKRVQHKPHRKNFSLKEQLDWVMLNLHAGGFWNKWMLEMYNNNVRVSYVGILTHCHCADIICVDVSG